MSNDKKNTEVKPNCEPGKNTLEPAPSVNKPSKDLVEAARASKTQTIANNQTVNKDE